MTEKLNIAGTAVVDTRTLVTLTAFADKAGFEYRLPIQVIAAMDWDGQHIVRVQHELMPGADTSRLDAEKDTGYVALDLTANTPLPCKVLIKTQGRKEPVEHMLSIKVTDYAALEQVYSTKFQTVDGQHKRMRWNG